MSVEINLLPWREARRVRRSRRFYLALGLMGVLGTGGGLGLTHLLQAEVAAQQQRNAHVRQALGELARDIRVLDESETLRQRLVEQLAVFQTLQQGRSQTVAVFRDLTRSLADGVQYTTLERRGERLDLTGLALTHWQVANQLRALDAAPSLDEPVLSTVEAQADEGGLRRFALSVQQRPPGEAVPSRDTASSGDDGEGEA